MIHLISNYFVEGTVDSSFIELRAWLKNRKWVTIDTETAGGDTNDTQVLMFQIGDQYNQWVIDCRDYGIGSLKGVLESTRIMKIGHNIKYDYEVIKAEFGIEMNNVWDTMLGEYLLPNYDKAKGYFSLEETHLRYYNENPYGNQLSLFDPWIPKHKRNEISKKLFEPFTRAEVHYGSTDIVTTSKVFVAQKEALIQEDLLEVMNLEREFVLVLGDMELNGMPIDIPRWLELAEWSRTKLEETEEVLTEQHPDVLNWNSSRQVATLFKAIGVPIAVVDKEKSREEVVYKDSVQEIVIKEHMDRFPIVRDYLAYKRYQKLSSTYGEKFLKYVSPVTNRIHSSFHQILNTGRTSSTSPNMQNVVSEKVDFKEGKWWREAFKAEKGNTFVICDYSSQELHIVADKSKDKEMLRILRERGDLHKAAAAALYDKKEEDVTPAERKQGKITNFAIVYGGGDDKIAEFFKIPRTKAKKMRLNYFKRFPSLLEFQNQSYAYALQNGHILIDQLGRKFYIKEHAELLELKKMAEDHNCSPAIRKRYLKLSGKIFRDSANYPIQGTAASMSKFAGVLIRKESQKNPGLFKILLLIHDEWVVECETKDAEQVKSIVEACMSKAAKAFCKSVQVPAEAIISHKWLK